MKKLLFVLLLTLVLENAYAQRMVTVYTTAQNTDKKLTSTGTISFEAMPQPVETQVCVFIDPTRTFQTYFGIGAALTDASAETFYKLPAAAQKEFLNAHFDKENGIGYTVGRTNINSCDFSSGSYTYVKDGDKELKSFDIAPDRKYKLPFIQECIKAAGGKLIMFASPWSPPAWMKTNNSMLQGGKLLPEYSHSWAMYYTKFIKSYENEGVPIWGISIVRPSSSVRKAVSARLEEERFEESSE
jgi:glucosylceramidase